MMNFLSIMTGAALLAWGTWVSVGDYGFFLNFQGALLIAGCAIIGTVFAFRLPYLVFFVPSFIANLLVRRDVNRRQTVKELAVLNDAFRSRNQQIAEMVTKSKDSFLRESMSLLMEGVVPPVAIARVLEARAHWIHERETTESRRLKTVARYVWMSTWVAFFIGFAGVLSNPPLLEMWGPAVHDVSRLSILPHFIPCLMTLVYGLGVSFLVIEPVAENLQISAEERFVKNKLVAHGVSLIAQQTNPLHFSEELNSFLSPMERVEWKAA